MRAASQHKEMERTKSALASGAAAFAAHLRCSTDLWRARDGNGMTDETPRRRAVLIGTPLLAVAVACSVLDPDAPSRAKLDGLLQQKATRAQVAVALGPGYTWYAPGTPEWQGLLDFLEREDARKYAPVVAAVESRRNVMYYATMWQQTWLFLDDSQRLQSYWTNTQ